MKFVIHVTLAFKKKYHLKNQSILVFKFCACRNLTKCPIPLWSKIVVWISNWLIAQTTEPAWITSAPCTKKQAKGHGKDYGFFNFLHYFVQLCESCLQVDWTCVLCYWEQDPFTRSSVLHQKERLKRIFLVNFQLCLGAAKDGERSLHSVV